MLVYGVCLEMSLISEEMAKNPDHIASNYLECFDDDPTEVYVTKDNLGGDNVWGSLKETSRSSTTFANVKLYPFRCCSKLVNKKLVIGVELVCYARKKMSMRWGKNPNCEDCDEYDCCDRCIGETINGFYDVSKMLDSEVTIPIEEFCGHCNQHKQTVAKKCPLCLHKNRSFDEERLKALRSTITEQIKSELGQSLPVSAKFQVYGVLDDCLSCN